MISAILDHLWQSTLLAAAIAVLAVIFRNARASVRYGLWLAASVKFLVPFAALAALGRLLAPEVPPPPEAATDVVFITQAAAPLSHAAITPHLGALPDPTLMLFGVWVLGCAVVLIIWMMRWARIRPLLRLATPVAIAAPMPVLATPTMLEPGLVGLWRPVLVVPQTLFDHLDRPGIDALVAHEACHYRRGDNLTAAIHMLVEALFWFHPMVWWIGGRLVEERERACDEAVVRAGHDPEVYAATLLECCRLFLQSPLRCVAGASGSDLSRRVETIMTSPLRFPLSRSSKAMLIAAGISALATPVAAGWLASPAERQAVPRAVALASSPASALTDETPAAVSAPDSGEVANTIKETRTEASPAASAPRIAAIRPQPVQLEPVAGDQPPSELAKPLLPATTAEIPDARVVPVADTEAPAVSSPADAYKRGAGGYHPKTYCMLARAVPAPASGPDVKTLCLTASEWRRVIIPQRRGPQATSAAGTDSFEFDSTQYAPTNAPNLAPYNEGAPIPPGSGSPGIMPTIVGTGIGVPGH